MIHAINPSDGQIFAKTHCASLRQVQRAVHSARKAYATWKNIPLSERILYVLSLKERLMEHEATLAEAISIETGKTHPESRQEAQSLVSKIDLSIKSLTDKIKDDNPAIPNHTYHKPLGVCCILGPFNFPMHLISTHLIPAVLSGNTVVFKPSELTSYSGYKYMEVLALSDIPQGVINMVQGDRVTGTELSSHENINALFFTGSSDAGRKLAIQFGRTPEKMLALEMGGNNAVIAAPPFDIENAAKIILLSAFQSSGQRCTCARRLIIVQHSKSASLLEALTDLSKNVIAAPPDNNPEPFMGPLIRSHAVNKLLRRQNQFLSSGHKSLLMASRLKNFKGFFITPGILKMNPLCPDKDEEIFGPFLKVYSAKNFSGALKIANHSRFGLAASLVSDDSALYQEFISEIETGIANWNTTTTGASGQLPFGGIKDSGNFRPGGYSSVEYCTHSLATIRHTQLSTPQIPGLKTF